MNDTTSDRDRRDKVRQFINDIGTAMMITVTSDGELHARPMATASVDEQWDTLWFATRRDSHKVDELSRDQRVCLTYVDASNGEWVSINGSAELDDSLARKRELWGVHWQNWFSGPEDPALVLIKVQPHHAEYWDTSSRAIQRLKLAAAAVTGRRADLGDHDTVEFETPQRRA